MEKSRRRQYAALLRVRKTQEDVEAQQLAAARRAVQRAQQELEAIEARQRAALDAAAHEAYPKVVPQRVDSFLQFERHLSREAVDKDLEVRSLQSKADGQRQVLEQAMKKRKTMEKLIERADEALASQQRRREQRFVDDTASVRHHYRDAADPSAL